MKLLFTLFYCKIIVPCCRVSKGGVIMHPLLKKALVIGGVVFLLFYLVTRPETAAGVVGSGGGFITTVLEGLTRFVDALLL